MNGCANCAWWLRTERDAPNWGRCLKAASSWGEPAETDSLAYAFDDYDYQAGLKTAAAFSCIQWKEGQAT